MRLTLGVALVAAALTAAPYARADWTITIQPAASPAAGQSGEPRLSASDRGVILSWIEQRGSNATLEFSRLRGDAGAPAWTEPRAVVSGDNLFVNWADVPSVVELADGTLAAHWLHKSGAGAYAYDVRVAFSKDDGRTWTPGVKPHGDSAQAEHGFASLFPFSGGLGLVWLDGREMTGEHGGHGGAGAMTLRFGAFDKSGKQTHEAAIDARVCECCPTAATMTADGPIAAYRDRGHTEVRDIHVTRLEDGKWSAPVPVHADNWTIAACPVNGPALAARGRTVALAWFTMRDGKGHAALAFSKDAGRTFSEPIALADSDTVGRVDAALLPDGSAIASWIEVHGERAEFKVRRVTPAGEKSLSVSVAEISSARASGYPRLAVHGDRVVFAWTTREDVLKVKTAVARLPRG
jgi:BNR repeat protein